MFEKIAKFRLLRARRAAPDRSAPANDNRRGAVQAGRRPQLVCRWSFDQGPHCRWEVAGPQEPNPLLADEPPAGGRIHTSVFVLSYDGPGAIGSGNEVCLRSRPICCRHVTSGQ
jgi:hypothetical protein